MKQNENGQSAAKRNWAIIEEAPEYMISTLGEVKRIKTGKILAYGSRKRYYTVTLFHNGEPLYRYVHRLVALAFIPRDDVTKNYVNHKDHNIHNNNVENLEWCTSSENARHSYEKERRKEEYQTKRSFIQPLMTEATKKAINQFDKEHNFIASYNSIREAERNTGIKTSNISRVLRGRGKTAGGFIWEYCEGSTTKCEGKPTSTAPNSETRDDIV